MEANIISIATGEAKNYGKPGNSFKSAYKKDNFFNSVEVNELGIINDIQVDKKYHGGNDKALHIGSSLHFENYEKEYGTKLDKLALGCNIIIDNLKESDICVGDIFTIGKIKIEISEPRQPCFKIGAIFGKEASRFIIKNSATGWYARVLQGGTLDKKEKIILEKRVSNITMKELNEYLIQIPTDKKLIEEILELKPLSSSYKDDFRKKMIKQSL